MIDKCVNHVERVTSTCLFVQYTFYTANSIAHDFYVEKSEGNEKGKRGNFTENGKADKPPIDILKW